MLGATKISRMAITGADGGETYGDTSAQRAAGKDDSGCEFHDEFLLMCCFVFWGCEIYAFCKDAFLRFFA